MQALSHTVLPSDALRPYVAHGSLRTGQRGSGTWSRDCFSAVLARGRKKHAQQSLEHGHASCSNSTVTVDACAHGGRDGWDGLGRSGRMTLVLSTSVGWSAKHRSTPHRHRPARLVSSLSSLSSPAVSARCTIDFGHGERVSRHKRHARYLPRLSISGPNTHPHGSYRQRRACPPSTNTTVNPSPHPLAPVPASRPSRLTLPGAAPRICTSCTHATTPSPRPPSATQLSQQLAPCIPYPLRRRSRHGIDRGQRLWWEPLSQHVWWWRPSAGARFARSAPYASA